MCMVLETAAQQQLPENIVRASVYIYIQLPETDFPSDNLLSVLVATALNTIGIMRGTVYCVGLQRYIVTLHYSIVLAYTV